MAWYYNKKENDNYATLSGNFDDINSTIEIEKGICKKVDDGYLMYGIFKGVTSVNYYKGGDNWKFEPQNCKILFHNQPWEKKIWNRDLRKFDGTQIQEPTEQEKVWCWLIEQNPIFMTGFKGVIEFKTGLQSQYFEAISTGVRNGNKLSKDTIDYLVSTWYSIESLESLDGIEAIAESETSKTYSSNRQTEYQRLQDRFKFVAEMVANKPVENPNLMSTTFELIGNFEAELNPKEIVEIYQVLLSAIMG